MAKKPSIEEIAKIAKISARLKEMNGNKDGKGAFLGDGYPSKIEVDIRALELASYLDEYLALLNSK